MTQQYRLVINSKDRTDGSSGSFSLDLSQSFDSVNRVRVQSCIIPQTYYPMTYGHNTLMVIIAGEDVPVVLESKFYNSGTEYATEIEARLNAAKAAEIGDFIVEFDTELQKLTVQNSSNNFQIDYDRTTCGVFTGFQGTGVTVSGSTVEAEGSVDLNPNRSLYIHSNIGRSDFIFSDSRHTNVLTTVPVSVDSKAVVIHYPPIEEKYKLDKASMQNRIELEIRDFNDEVVDLNGVDWELTLMFSG